MGQSGVNLKYGFGASRIVESDGPYRPGKGDLGGLRVAVSKAPRILIQGDRVVISARGKGSVSQTLTLEKRRTAPIVKWAGGKQWLSRAIHLFLPADWDGGYFEPFLGAGAIYFSLQPKQAVLSDSCAELIAMYRAIREDPEGVIQLLKTYPNDRDFFYSIRRKGPEGRVAQAARFIYLNRTCWNGLYRVNRRGEFNTPFGQKKNPTICNEDRIRAAAKHLEIASLKACDFSESVGDAGIGDLVFFDPPHVAAGGDNGFAKYNATLFSWRDQERLAKTSLSLAKDGAHIIVSNTYHRSVVSLYHGFHTYRIRRRSLLGSDPASRRLVYEGLLTSYPIMGQPGKVVP